MLEQPENSSLVKPRWIANQILSTSKLPLPQSGWYARLMRPKDIAARFERLTKLSAGFGKEVEILRKQRLAPSLHRDARHYLAAIQAAQDAVDRAWMTFLKLKQRLAKLPPHR